MDVADDGFGRTPPAHVVHPAHVAADPEEELVLERRGPWRRTEFLGIPFTPMTAETLLRRTLEQAARRDPFVFVVTPNVDHAVRLEHAPEFGETYLDAWANPNDSRVLELLAGWAGIALPAAPGSDLAAKVLEVGIDPHEPVVVIGATADVIEAVKARHGLTDVRWHEPPMGLKRKPEAVAAAAAFMAANPARFHFLCVGSPQQEMVARAAKARGDVVGVGLCVGASLDFVAGRQKRAPDWMRAVRLEWLFRLVTEPRRLWRRYLVEAPNVFRLYAAWRIERNAQG